MQSKQARLKQTCLTLAEVLQARLKQTSLTLAEAFGGVRSWMQSKREMISSRMTSSMSSAKVKLTEAFQTACQWAKSKYELISRQMARSPPADLKEPLLEEGCPEANHPKDVNKAAAEKQQDANKADADGHEKQQEVTEAALESDSDESAVLVNADDAKSS